MTALWTSGVAKADSRISIALVALATASALALLLFGGTFFEAVVLILAGLLTLATILTVALGVIDQGEANVKAVTGAVCIYVLIGMLFVFLYGVIAAVSSGDFFAQGTDGTRSLRLYFSYVTLATLGLRRLHAGPRARPDARGRRGPLRPALPGDGDRACSSRGCAAAR